MIFTVSYKHLSLSFFGSWPRSALCHDAAQGAYLQYNDWVVERTEYYAKVDPFCVLRDSLPLDVLSQRLRLANDVAIDLLQYIFKDFEANPVAIYEKNAASTLPGKSSMQSMSRSVSRR